MDERSARLLEESNRVGISFLLTDLKTVLTFLNLADVTVNEGTRLRNRTQARNGYRAILRHLPRIRPSPEQRLEIEEKLAAIKSRLEKAGISLDDADLSY